MRCARSRAKESLAGALPCGRNTPIDVMRTDGVVVENPAKMATIRRVRSCIPKAKGIKTIADTLTAEGRPPPKKSWNTDSVRRILTKRVCTHASSGTRSGAIRDQDLVKKRIAELRERLTYKEVGSSSPPRNS